MIQPQNKERLSGPEEAMDMDRIETRWSRFIVLHAVCGGIMVELWCDFGVFLLKFGGIWRLLGATQPAANCGRIYGGSVDLWPKLAYTKKKTLMITCTSHLGKLYQFKEFVCDSYSQY